MSMVGRKFLPLVAVALLIAAAILLGNTGRKMSVTRDVPDNITAGVPFTVEIHAAADQRTSFSFDERTSNITVINGTTSFSGAVNGERIFRYTAYTGVTGRKRLTFEGTYTSSGSRHSIDGAWKARVTPPPQFARLQIPASVNSTRFNITVVKTVYPALDGTVTLTADPGSVIPMTVSLDTRGTGPLREVTVALPNGIGSLELSISGIIRHGTGNTVISPRTVEVEAGGGGSGGG